MANPLLSYLNKRLGRHEGSGVEVTFSCPACLDRVGSEGSKLHLHINLAKGAMNCFRCEFSANLYKLFVFLNGGIIRPEERVFLGREEPLRYASFNELRREWRRESDGRLRAVRLPKEARPIAGDAIGVHTARRYMERRGVKDVDAVAALHQLHYASSGRYGGHILFPCFEHGVQVYFTTRAASKTALLKSKNPRKAEGFYGKSDTLLGLDVAARHERVLIVEGPFDMLAAPKGVGAVALMGKVASQRQLSLLAHLARSDAHPELVVALDADAQSHAVELHRRLRSRGVRVTLLRLGEGDPWSQRATLPSLMHSRVERVSLTDRLALQLATT